VEWEKTYGDSDDDGAWSLIQTADGGYAVAGYTESTGAGSRDAYLLKLDAKGKIEWEKTYGGSHLDSARSLIKTADGGYAAAGYTYYSRTFSGDVYLLKLNEEGNLKE